MLRASEVSVRFGGVVAVDGVSFAVRSGETVGVVGPNGSGKSTLLNAICGLNRAGGALWIEDRPLRLGRPDRVRAAGLLRTFQTPQTFLELSCIENVLLSTSSRAAGGMLGALFARPRMWRADLRRIERGYAALQRVGLEALATRPAAGLSYGQHRYLEIARAIAGEPRILVMDEPSAGLNQAETENLLRLLRGLREDGMTLLVVDHKIDFLRRLCGRIIVLRLGRVIADGAPDEVFADQAVVEAYLGSA
ncbi:ABC transporter ATP-binding protein [Actinomadura sp. NBRC 104412]|uniref:ABC transporter ATP-binding protein n=1 Tax=Actinomadura sp. NBRC 104412 TaxID=3032203 RepID=UPI0024A0D06B|nr:ATP-binding cassette domain-containing protein [Actinomadura sp. NBRC 104412]GLZ02730.1 ABC transporter ATP-binding protein [Actinomadura sp. NBRC 104412]